MADNKKQFIGKDRLNDILTWLHTWLGNNVPKVVHLTWAEYQDLPDTKYTDGVEYWIDDAPTGASTLLVSLTEAEYLAIPETTRINSDKLYFVYDVDSVWESGDVRYKNTTVKAALDRLVPEVFLTKAEFDLLKASGGLYPGTKYTQTDEQYDFKSEAISYGSSDVKTALDTINQNITNIDNKVTWKEVSTMGVVPSTATEVKFVIIGGSSVFQNIFDYSLFTSDLQWFEVGGFYLNASSNARAVVQASKNALGVRKLYMGGAEQTITFKMFYH